MRSRRAVLQLIGGGVVVAAAAGGGFVALNGPSMQARAPWRSAGNYTEPRRRALSFAILAPNPHNQQAWKVRLEGDDRLTLFCDLERRLPVTDPFDRQTTIGLGAFLELLALAAGAGGHHAEIILFPEGEDMTKLDTRAVAHVAFKPDASRRDPLFAHVLARRSNKDVYEDRAAPVSALVALAQAATFQGASGAAEGDTARVTALRDLTWRAHQTEVMTRPAMQESVDLMRIGAREVAANPDGIELEGPMIAAGSKLGIISRATLADPTSTAFQQGLDLYRAKALSARAFGWIVNDNATRTDQIAAGRAYVRANLTATALGLGVHPWSQALQEYPAMADHFREVHDLVGAGRRVQMLYRIGYAKPVGPAPRWPLESKLVG